MLWESNEIEWVKNGANNSVRGLIMICRKYCFQMSKFFKIQIKEIKIQYIFC